MISKPEQSEALGVSGARPLVGRKKLSVCWFAVRGAGRISILLRTGASPDWTATACLFYADVCLQGYALSRSG